MKVSNIFVGLMGLTLASHVWAAAAEVEIGSEYQVNVTNTNDGLNDKDVGKQTKTTNFNLKGAKVVFRGKLSDQISWTALYKVKEGELERFYLTNKVTENLDITVGKQKIKTYGLHRKLTSSTTTPVIGSYLDLNPMKDKLAVDLTYKLAGTLSLQLVEDYSKCTETTTYTKNATSDDVTPKTETTCPKSWNTGSTTGTTQKQPAIALEWYGSFGDISPLVQYAVYDLGKSSTASVGVRYKADGLDTYFDYTMDTRNIKGNDPTAPAGETKYIKEKNTYTGLVAYAEYKVGTYTPFVHVSTLTTDPYEVTGANDVKKVSLEANAQGKLDKNEMTIAVGTHFDNWGAYYRPFVNVTMSSGEYADPTTSAGVLDKTLKTSDKKKDLSKADLVVGLIGKF